MLFPISVSNGITHFHTTFYGIHHRSRLYFGYQLTVISIKLLFAIRISRSINCIIKYYIYFYASLPFFSRYTSLIYGIRFFPLLSVPIFRTVFLLRYTVNQAFFVWCTGKTIFAINLWSKLLYCSGEGCEDCDCDPVGSTGPTCDLYVGQCNCK